MRTVGIICEYNPLHNGHIRQMEIIREQFGEDTAIVCLMSGNYVQRGAPAIFDKSIRAEAALRCGADLVLELPVTACLSSAEGFASAGVSILSQFCDTLSFGCESMTKDNLFQFAAVLISEDFSSALKEHMKSGISFPTAQEKALKQLLPGVFSFNTPNDILAVEYCKSILRSKSDMQIFPIKRTGDYHSAEMDCHFPSATAIRNRMLSHSEWESAVPISAAALYKDSSLHSIEYGEKAILYRVKTMTEEEFSMLPYGAEGFWRRFMHACKDCSSLEKLVSLAKTKRYTRTRIDRMLMCAFLGITESDFSETVPYTRILGFNAAGRAILNNHKSSYPLLNTGAKGYGKYWELEQRADTLYSLFASENESVNKRRIISL